LVAVAAFALMLSLTVASPTDSPTRWMSCDECQKGFNRTHNWECRFGCDRFVRRVRPRSVTVPTGSPTRKGEYFLDCKKCYGHGLVTKDPRCKYGCGRWFTYPHTTPPTTTTTTTITTTTAAVAAGDDEQKPIQINSNRLHPGPVKSNKSDPNKSSGLPDDDSPSKRTYSTQYKLSFLVIGLAMGVAVTIAGYVVYKKTWRRKMVSVEDSRPEATVVYNNNT